MVNYVKPDVSIHGSRSIYNFNEIEKFYNAQKARFWNGRDMTFSPDGAKFHFVEKTGQLHAFTSKTMARLTDPHSNKYLPLNSIAIQAGIEFVRDSLGFKDLGEYYSESNSNSRKRDFYHVLVERGWLEQSQYSHYISFGMPFNKYVHFLYKTFSSNGNDFGIIGKFRSKEVEYTEDLHMIF